MESRGDRQRRDDAQPGALAGHGLIWRLESEQRSAKSDYQHALEALDRARLNADRQQIFVADFVPPRLPEEALYPRRARSVAIAFMAGFVIWGDRPA